MAILNYTNNVTAGTPDPTVIGNGTAAVSITPETTLFIEKYSHTQDEDISGGDAVGFTIVFGNYSVFPYTAAAGADATLEDVLTIAEPISLVLRALSLCEDCELWVVAENGASLANPYQLEEGAVLEAGTYTLQLRQLQDGALTAAFDIPCNYIESISMLFTVTGCPNA